jgi:hypothetical protein
MLYLFSVYRRRAESGVEYFSGTSPIIPVAGYWDRVEVSKLVFRLDEKVVKYVRKTSDGLGGKQRFHELGYLGRQRTADGREFFLGMINNIPVIAYWDYRDVDKLNVFIDEKNLKVLSEQAKKDALEKKAKTQTPEASPERQSTAD